MSESLRRETDGTQKIRDCAERWCKELLVKKRREQGDETAMIADYTGPAGMLGPLIAEVTPYLDSDEPGKLKMLAEYTNPGNHDGDVASMGALKVSLGDLKKLKQKYLS